MLFTYPLAFANILTSTRKHAEFCGFYSISTQTTRAGYLDKILLINYWRFQASRQCRINYPEYLYKKPLAYLPNF